MRTLCLLVNHQPSRDTHFSLLSQTFAFINSCIFGSTVGPSESDLIRYRAAHFLGCLFKELEKWILMKFSVLLEALGSSRRSCMCGSVYPRSFWHFTCWSLSSLELFLLIYAAPQGPQRVLPPPRTSTLALHLPLAAGPSYPAWLLWTTAVPQPLAMDTP